MKGDLGIFIIWEKARKKEQEILKDISEKFNILQLFEIKWGEGKKDFVYNLKRFYGKKLISLIKKTFRCGNGNFIMAIISDSNPQIDKNGMSSNVLNAKRIYREMTGGGFLVHSSDNQNDANLNTTVITGMSVKELLNSYGTVDSYNENLKPIFLRITNN